MEQRDNLIAYVNRTLNIDAITDYCPNGLQVEGRDEVHHLVTGVTASTRFLEAAIAAKADAVLVHHGYFWKGESQVITGMKLKRIRLLLEANISLLAYHLPLDVHPVFGNNAQLAKLFGFKTLASVAAGGTNDLLLHGEIADGMLREPFIRHISKALGREVVAVGGSDKPIKRVAWCSGGAQRFLLQAADLGVDAFISGEISEQTTHEARESGVLYIAGGHHATERFGVQAIGENLAEQLQLTHQYIDVDNPA